MSDVEDFNLESCLLDLANRRPIFHSEADFQFALAQTIQDRYKRIKIRLELNSEIIFCDKKREKHRLDLLVFYDGRAIPIELKYKTKRFSTECVLYEDKSIHESFSLANHSALDDGCYDCLKDIHKIEHLPSKIAGCYRGEGYVIWLTNDEQYWKGKESSAAYRNFLIRNGATKTGILKWVEPRPKYVSKKRQDPIILHGIYEIDWKEYKGDSVNRSLDGLFKYCLLKIENYCS